MQGEETARIGDDSSLGVFLETWGDFHKAIVATVVATAVAT